MSTNFSDAIARLAIFASLAAVLAPHAASQQSLDSFFRPTLEHVPIADDSSSVLQFGAVGDIDGDGAPDVIAGVGPLARTYRNDGRGIFRSTPLAAAVAGLNAYALVDADGDGDLDLVSELGTQRNDGAGNFASAPIPPIGTLPMATTLTLAPADVDGDGDLDLVVAKTNGLIVLRNDGSGTFTVDTTAFPSPAVFRVENIAAGDLDGDGDIDLVVSAAGSPIVVMRNDGTGGFVASQLAVITGILGSDVTLGDADGDGDLDLATVTSDGLAPTSTTRILANDGVGGFGPGADLTVGNVISARSLRFADFDRDGRLDLLESGIGNTGTGTRIHYGTGPMQFDTVLISDSGRAAPRSFLVPTDVDRDGDLDIILRNDRDVAFGYLIQDVDGTFIDATERVYADAGRTMAALDIDGDGRIERIDLVGDQLRLVNVDFAGDETSTLLATYDLIQDIEVVDIDNDGDLDIAIAAGGSQFEQRPRLLLQTAAGFEDVTGSRMPLLTTSAVEIESGDFDGNGTVDLLIAGSTTLLLLQSTNGVFFQRAGQVSSARSIASGDIDGDGDRDYIAYSEVGATAMTVVALNTGLGYFLQYTDRLNGPAPRNARQLELVDIDGDGQPDLIVGDDSGVEVWLNTGGVFIQQQSILDVELRGLTRSFALADLDDDGDLDLVAAVDQFNGTTTVGEVQLHRRDAALSFVRVPGTLPALPTTKVKAQDLDGDLDVDLFWSGATYINRLRHLVSSYVPRAGGVLRYEFHLVGGGQVIPMLATAIAATPLQTIAGPITLDLASTAFLAPIATGPGDIAQIEAVLPDLPALVGVELDAQGITWNGVRYGVTNTVSQDIAR